MVDETRPDVPHGMADFRMSPSAPNPASRQVPEIPPIALSTAQIVGTGMLLWVIALVVILVVPGLRTGNRDWWLWAALAGVVLGILGYTYVRRGRGNAADAPTA